MFRSSQSKMISPLHGTVALVGMILVIVGYAAIHLSDIDNYIYRHSGAEILSFHHLEKSEVFLGLPEMQSAKFEFKIYSHNVRVDTRNRFPHEKKWRDRLHEVVRSIEECGKEEEDGHEVPTLVGLQELKHHQLNDILKGLNHESYDESPWTHYGVGRDDGDTKGEYTPILYNRNVWTLVNGTTKWLSEHPDVPERSWGAATKRVITFTTFQNVLSGNYINYINTHLDHKSIEAKKRSADLIIEWIKSIPNEYPTFLSGDFNSEQSEVAYQTIAHTMQDAFLVALSKQKDNHVEDPTTYTGWEPESVHTVIDFLWYYSGYNSSFVEVESFTILPNENNGVRFSDHKPLEATYMIEIV